MRLASLVSEGSGQHNEDGCGYIEQDSQVTAAWVFDGVTGINGKSYLPASSDAQWLVAKADAHLKEIAQLDLSLPKLLALLVDALIKDWSIETQSLSLPEGYDIPGACLILAKKYSSGWKALRLGDSMIIADGKSFPLPTHAHSDLEAKLTTAAAGYYAKGITDPKIVFSAHYQDMIAARRSRNIETGLGILFANPTSLNRPELIDLGHPKSLLLCTDGYYRAVDHYGLWNDAELLDASLDENGTEKVLKEIRRIERADPSCQKFPRIKPFDDATAIALAR